MNINRKYTATSENRMNITNDQRSFINTFKANMYTNATQCCNSYTNILIYKHIQNEQRGEPRRRELLVPVDLRLGPQSTPVYPSLP